jgi:hypothetical protein
MTASTSRATASPLLAAIGRNPAALLSFFDLPVSFHRSYIRMTGRVTSALLLSVAVQAVQDEGDIRRDRREPWDGWTPRSVEQWMEETGLTREELLSARRRLRELGVLIERSEREDRGMRVRMSYRVDFDRLSQLLAEQAQSLLPPDEPVTA